jgi:hypothetical protein
MRWIEDQLLRLLQHRCKHPDSMVAVDILEGSGKDIEVQYCRRCGAVRPIYQKELRPTLNRPWKPIMPSWRLPEPNLWRG